MKDWRGKEINVGDTIVYGRYVDKIIYPVVGMVESTTYFKGSEQVEITPLQCSDQNAVYSGKRPVYVTPSKLTVVTLERTN